MRKQAVITPLGMNRDLAMSKFDMRFAYENKNLRLVTDDATSKLVMTNERGPARIEVWFEKKGGWEVGDIYGIVLGTAVIDNHLVLFTHGYFDVIDPQTHEIVRLDRDRIYRIDFEDDATDGKPVKGYELYRGDLGFDLSHPIETMPFYETEDIKKVYWTDGLNQPRMINIMADTADYNDKYFDFAQEISGYEQVGVTRVDNTNGMFPSGVVQYAFTYYRKYGQESSVACVSPMHFIADDNRGSAPDESVACSFDLLLTGLSKVYDGVRLYSIVRSAFNGTPVVKRIADLEIQYQPNDAYGYVQFTDNNTTGEDVENTYLLYVGAKDVTIETMTQKDNTAFYGNIEVKHGTVSDGLRAKLKGEAFDNLGFVNAKNVFLPDTTGKYDWKSQLRRSSKEIRYFKYGETYRFGVQLQDRYGNWSDVIRIESGVAADGNDFKQNEPPVNTVRNRMVQRGTDVFASPMQGEKHIFATFRGSLDLEQLEGLLDDYIAIRPVVVYPEGKDQTVLAQGILTPTVYNLDDRVKGGTYAQMSWFSRPLASNASLNADVNDIEQTVNNKTKHSVLEFRHYRPLPPTNRYFTENTDISPKAFYGSNAELLCDFEGYIHRNRGTENETVLKTTDYTFWANVYPWQERAVYNASPSIQDRANQLRSEFFVDQSVETFHSPDVEYSDRFANMDMDGVKMRIVGLVPLTYNNEGVYMAADRITADNYLHIQERYTNLGGTSASHNAFRQFTEFGGVQADFDDTFSFARTDIHATYYGTNKVYPWHTKTLTHEIIGQRDESDFISDSDLTYNFKSIYRAEPRSTLAKKIYDSIKYSYDTLYFGNAVDVDIDKPSYFNTVDSGKVRLEVDGQNTHFDFNVDKAVIPSTRKNDATSLSYINGFVYPGAGTLFDHVDGDDNNTSYGPSGVLSGESVPMKYRGTSALVFHLSSIDDDDNVGKKKVAPLPKYGAYNDVLSTDGTSREQQYNIEWINTQSMQVYTQPLTNHAINMANKRFVWDDSELYSGFQQTEITDNANVRNIITGNGYGFFYLAELYRDNVTNRFGGDSEEAVASNTWLPCGETVPLRNQDGTLKTTVEVNWREGDTYYQRYDNIHTYPFTEDDVNQVVDIVSFMCETKVNIDGRYDRNRGLENNETIRPTNANRLNTVYGQHANYFQYRAVDHGRIQQSLYPTTVAWTKTKQLGEYADSWTNITLANSMGMDGSKGQVRALRRHFDDILVFQDTAVSRVLFNEQQAVQTTAGVPLEIANSGKVSGHYFLNPTIGCHNKWSIATSPNGTYFMDDAEQDILFINGERQIKSVAGAKGFRSWARANADIAHKWDQSEWKCMRTLYDKNNSELMFVTSNEALSFNEPFDAFTSFYDYWKTPYLETVKKHHVMLRNEGGFGMLGDLQPRTYLFEHNAGRYNDFFGVYRPYWTELLCHSDGTDRDSPLLDKTWTNVGFQFDTFDDSYTDPKERYKEWEHWDVVDCETEYQKGSTNWYGRYPGIGKKFRMWHADLPRDGYTVGADGYNADRLRNPWLKMRLTKNTNISRNWRSVLHSVTIGYLE